LRPLRSGDSSASPHRMETPVYIGIGTLVLVILIVILLIILL
jgi:hypothetical protein